MSLIESPHHLHALHFPALPTPGAIFAVAGAAATALMPNEHLSAGYLIGVIGMGLYYGCRVLAVWLDRKHETSALKRQIRDSEERGEDLKRTIEDLRAELRDQRSRHATEIQTILAVAITGRLEDLAGIVPQQQPPAALEPEPEMVGGLGTDE
jgi:hypothetical protein